MKYDVGANQITYIKIVDPLLRNKLLFWHRWLFNVFYLWNSGPNLSASLIQ